MQRLAMQSGVEIPNDGGEVPVTIQSGPTVHKFYCKKNAPVLYEALRAGIPLPYSCGTGTCGTCAIRLVDGTVTNLWPEAPGLPRSGKGRILACQSTASSAITLRNVDGAHSTGCVELRPSYFSLRRIRIEWLTETIAQLWLETDCRLKFAPGQYILLWIPGVNGPRAFSIANVDRDPSEDIRLLVKPRPGSGLEHALHAALVLGPEVRGFGPLGNACLRAGMTLEAITCVAGSTGIAPMLPILADWADSGSAAAARLIYGVRTIADAVALDDIQHIARRAAGRLTTTISISAGDAEAVQVMGGKTKGFADVTCGNAHEAMLMKVDRKSPLGNVFVAGPKVMVQATVRALISQLGVSPSAVHCDEFG